MQKNKIHCMDVKKFLQKLENSTIDLIIADPPYNISVDDWDVFKSQEEYFEFMYGWLKEAIRVLSKKGSMYIFNTPYNNALLLPKLIGLGFTYQNWITWYKKDGFSVAKTKYINNQESILFVTKNQKGGYFNYDDIRVPYESGSRMAHAAKKGILKNGKRWYPNPNGKLCTDVWHVASHRHMNKVNGKLQKQAHSTPKPEIIIERMIKASSNKDSIVLDLFSGTGTTAKVAKKLSRNFIGCEINKKYVNLVNKELKNVR